MKAGKASVPLLLAEGDLSWASVLPVAHEPALYIFGFAAYLVYILAFVLQGVVSLQMKRKAAINAKIKQDIPS